MGDGSPDNDMEINLFKKRFPKTKMKQKNILFVCKHNLFRSKVAESYFNKIIQNRWIKARSAGVIKADIFNETQKKVYSLEKSSAKKFGIIINPKFSQLRVSFLKKQDLIIIVANDIPISVFNNKTYIKKAIVWKIEDSLTPNKDLIKSIIKQIMKKVDGLVKELK